MTAMMTGHAPISADVLSHAEVVALADCEHRIERGMKTFIEVGMALAAIQQNRLYRGRFDTFEEYCAERWGFTGRRGRQLIEAAEIGTMVPIVNERQARALATVPEAARAEILAEATERTGGKPTAKAIRDVAEGRAEPKADPEPTETPGPDGAAPIPPADPGMTPAPATDAPGSSRESGSGASSPAPELPSKPPPRLVDSPEEVEAARMEEQRVQIVDRARRRAPRLVHEIRALVVEVMSGMNLGETGLITPQTIAEIRELVDALEARMEATQ